MVFSEDFDLTLAKTNNNDTLVELGPRRVSLGSFFSQSKMNISYFCNLF